MYEGEAAESERGLSITIMYAITLAITALLIVGLALSSGVFESTEREQVIAKHLQSDGQRLAGAIEETDRLFRSTNGTVENDVDLPRTAGESPYLIGVRSSNCSGTITLNTSAPEVEKTVSFTTRSPVRNFTAQGGPITLMADEPGVYLEGDSPPRDIDCPTAPVGA